MSTKTLFRASGLALMAGALLFVVSTPLTAGAGLAGQASQPLFLPARLGQIVAGSLL